MGTEEQIKTIERSLLNPTVAKNPNLKGGLEKKLETLRERLLKEEETGVKYETPELELTEKAKKEINTPIKKPVRLSQLKTFLKDRIGYPIYIVARNNEIINEPREVSVVQNLNYASKTPDGRESWAEFPKAKELQLNDKGFAFSNLVYSYDKLSESDAKELVESFTSKSEPKPDPKKSLENNIKIWYKAKFPKDSIVDDISETATFNGLEKNIPNVYDYVGVGDSIVRERVFEELSKRLGVSYNEVYNKWLDADTPPPKRVESDTMSRNEWTQKIKNHLIKEIKVDKTTVLRLFGKYKAEIDKYWKDGISAIVTATQLKGKQDVSNEKDKKDKPSFKKTDLVTFRSGKKIYEILQIYWIDGKVRYSLTEPNGEKTVKSSLEKDLSLYKDKAPRSIHDGTFTAFKDGQRATYFIDIDKSGIPQATRHTGSVDMPMSLQINGFNDLDSKFDKVVSLKMNNEKLRDILTPSKKTPKNTVNIDGEEVDCDDLIAEEKERLAKRRKSSKEYSKKRESTKNIARVKSAKEQIENSLNERLDKGEMPSKSEIEKLLSQAKDLLSILEEYAKEIKK